MAGTQRIEGVQVVDIVGQVHGRWLCQQPPRPSEKKSSQMTNTLSLSIIYASPMMIHHLPIVIYLYASVLSLCSHVLLSSFPCAFAIDI